MERAKNFILKIFLIAGCFFMILPGLFAQDLIGSNFYFAETYAKGNIEGWDQAIRDIELQHPGFDGVAVALAARYGLTGYLVGTKQTGRAKKLLEETERLLETALKKWPDHPRLLSIRAGLTGIKIGLTPWRAPLLGQRNLDDWEKALSLDVKEPLAWLEKGNSLFYRPAMFGGNKQEAEAAFRKASELMPSSECNWLGLFIRVRLFEACKANGKTDEALKIKGQLQQNGQFRWLDELK